MTTRPRPTQAELQAAAGKNVADVIAPNLKILFCGINPGLYTAAVGHHFARPGNRFWPALQLGGFTSHLLTAYEERELLKYGYGITNLVMRATAGADELKKEEYVAGGRALEEKVIRYRPKCLAILGLGAYRTAFGRRQAVIGLQEEKMGDTLVWVLPNPSGLNAHYQLKDLAQLFEELRLAVEAFEG